MTDSCARTDTGRVRSRNEDYFRIDPEFGLYVLADGMGGAKGGDYASKLAADTVVDEIVRSGERTKEALVESVKRANENVLFEARRNPRLEGMGTTLVAALDLYDRFAIASVGDSRAYLFGAGGLRAITEDQTWVREIAIPLGLDEEAVSRHPYRHVLTMAVGLGDPIQIHSYEVDFTPGSLLLLSTDGLHGVVPQNAIETILGENRNGHNTLEEKCYGLIQAACNAGGPDNITVILIRKP